MVLVHDCGRVIFKYPVVTLVSVVNPPPLGKARYVVFSFVPIARRLAYAELLI